MFIKEYKSHCRIHTEEEESEEAMLSSSSHEAGRVGKGQDNARVNTSKSSREANPRLNPMLNYSLGGLNLSFVIVTPKKNALHNMGVVHPYKFHSAKGSDAEKKYG